MARVTIRLPDDLDDAVEEFVGYGSKSAFYRDAAQEKLSRETDSEPTEAEEKAAD